MFASENAFRQIALSRRDDLISLTYILTHFLNGKLLWLGSLKRSDPDYFKKVGKVKKNLGLQ